MPKKISISLVPTEGVSISKNTHVKRLRKLQALEREQSTTYTLHQIMHLLADPEFKKFFNTELASWEKDSLQATLKGMNTEEDGTYFDMLHYVKALLDNYVDTSPESVHLKYSRRVKNSKMGLRPEDVAGNL